MKLTSVKGYKKPLYAIGITATIIAASVTGCSDPGSGKGKPVNYAGDIDIRTVETTETTPLELDGEVAVTEPTETPNTELITAGIVPNNIR